MSDTTIGLGLAALGRPDYINIRFENNVNKSVEAFKANTFKVLDDSYDLGIRDFDVAPSYGLGEQFLLEWHTLRGFKDVSLSTKFGYTYVANWELGFKGKHEIKEHSISKLNEQWNVSKALLPNLKIYQIHSATLDSGVLTNNTVQQRLHNLKKQQHLKIGITTSGPKQNKIIEEAEKVTFDGVDLYESYQVTYNIFEQSCFKLLNQLLAKRKTVIIKEALANGRLFKNSKFPKYESTYGYLTVLSNKYNVGIDAIAIRFIIDSLAPTLVLSGASNTPQLKDNLKALNFELTEDEVETLKSFSVAADDYWLERSNLEWN